MGGCVFIVGLIPAQLHRTGAYSVARITGMRQRGEHQQDVHRGIQFHVIPGAAVAGDKLKAPSSSTVTLLKKLTTISRSSRPRSHFPISTSRLSTPLR